MALHLAGRNAEAIARVEACGPSEAGEPSTAWISFDSVLGSGACASSPQDPSILIIRTAPLLVFEGLVAELRSRHRRRIHVLTRKDSCARIAQQDGVERIHAMPNRRFRYPNDLPALERDVIETSFDLVIVLLSHWDPEDNRDVLALSAALNAKRCVAYGMDQLGASDRQCMFRQVPNQHGEPNGASR